MKRWFVVLFVVLFCTSNVSFAKSSGKGKHKGKMKVEKSVEEQAAKINEMDDMKGAKKESEELREKADEEKTETKMNKERIRKEKKAKKEKAKGKKTEPPEGVRKAAEKGKGEKKGLFERWFGGSKKDSD